jgi:DNA replication and repair protein RecF
VRALLLALKIAQVQDLVAACGEPPLLLLDDVLSELDARRGDFLMGFVGEMGAWWMLTTTERPEGGGKADFFQAIAGETAAVA